MAGTTLALPGSAPLAIAAPTTGMQKLDPRFLAMLSQAKIEDAICTTLGDKGYDTAELFGSFPTEVAFRSFCKRILKVDPETEDDDILRYSRLSIVYKACMARTEVENKERVERAVAQLPPQLTENDYDTARRAYEADLGYELPEHLVPSRPFFEKLLAQAESQFEAIKLTHVTSFAEQKVLLPGCGSSGVKWDEKAKTFKEEVKDFEVDMPTKPEDLEQRMQLLEHCWSMVKMRYGSNPRLATAEAKHFIRYTQWLKGTQVWNFVIKGSDNLPCLARRSRSCSNTNRQCERSRPSCSTGASTSRKLWSRPSQTRI